MGAKAKYFHGAGGIILRDLGRSMHYFREQGSAPPPPLGGKYIISFYHMICFCSSIHAKILIMRVDLFYYFAWGTDVYNSIL